MTTDHDLEPPYGFTDGQVTYKCETCHVRVPSLFVEEHEEWHEKLSRDSNDLDGRIEALERVKSETTTVTHENWPPPPRFDPQATENRRVSVRKLLNPAPPEWLVPPPSDWNKLPSTTTPSQAFVRKLNDPAAAPDKQWLRERPAMMYDELYPPKPAEKKVDLVSEMVAFIEDAGVPVNEYVLVNEMMKSFGFTRKTVAQALFEAISWDKPARLVRYDKELVFLPAPELPDAVKDWRPLFSV